MSGQRTQNYYGQSSTALITGMVPPGGWLWNDNVIQTYYPVLSIAGLSYSFDRNVTQVGDPTNYTMINLYMESGPV